MVGGGAQSIDGCSGSTSIAIRWTPLPFSFCSAIFVCVACVSCSGTKDLPSALRTSRCRCTGRRCRGSSRRQRCSRRVRTSMRTREELGVGCQISFSRLCPGLELRLGDDRAVVEHGAVPDSAKLVAAHRERTELIGGGRESDVVDIGVGVGFHTQAGTPRSRGSRRER